MPPAPSGATISNGPSLLPGARAIIGRDYTLGNPFSGTSSPHLNVQRTTRGNGLPGMPNSGYLLTTPGWSATRKLSCSDGGISPVKSTCRRWSVVRVLRATRKLSRARSLSVVSEARVSKLHRRARCVCALSIQRLEGRRWRLRRMRANGYGNSIFSPICKLLVLRYLENEHVREPQFDALRWSMTRGA